MFQKCLKNYRQGPLFHPRKEGCEMKSRRRILLMVATLALAVCMAVAIGGCAPAGESTQSASSAPTTSSESAPASSANSEQDVSASSDASAQAVSVSSVPSASSAVPASSEQPAAAELDFYNPGDGYKLQQVVVLSRHNIRAPLSTTGSALDLATPHT